MKSTRIRPKVFIVCSILVLSTSAAYAIADVYFSGSFENYTILPYSFGGPMESRGTPLPPPMLDGGSTDTDSDTDTDTDTDTHTPLRVYFCFDDYINPFINTCPQASINGASDSQTDKVFNRKDEKTFLANAGLVVFIGYTDKEGRRFYNYCLGLERARTARERFLESQYPDKKISRKSTALYSCGELGNMPDSDSSRNCTVSSEIPQGCLSEERIIERLKAKCPGKIDCREILHERNPR